MRRAQIFHNEELQDLHSVSKIIKVTPVQTIKKNEGCNGIE